MAATFAQLITRNSAWLVTTLYNFVHHKIE